MVNVGRTDFLTNHVNGAVGLEYDSTAFAHITRLLLCTKFYISSDDIDRSREHLMLGLVCVTGFAQIGVVWLVFRSCQQHCFCLW